MRPWLSSSSARSVNTPSDAQRLASSTMAAPTVGPARQAQGTASRAMLGSRIERAASALSTTQQGWLLAVRCWVPRGCLLNRSLGLCVRLPCRSPRSNSTALPTRGTQAKRARTTAAARQVHSHNSRPASLPRVRSLSGLRAALALPPVLMGADRMRAGELASRCCRSLHDQAALRGQARALLAGHECLTPPARTHPRPTPGRRW